MHFVYVGISDHLQVTQLIQELPLDELVKLGEVLGLSYPNVKRMRDRPGDMLGDMVAAWLRQEDYVIEKSGDPTWNSLAKALKEIGQHGIAKQVKLSMAL